MRRLVLLAPLLLAACGTGRTPRSGSAAAGPGTWSCVPYARARSGIALRGDAWQWWEAAAGRYARGRAPRPGSVLVLMRTSRLPQGHVAVVTRLVSAREIRVDHANWASGREKGQEARDQPVQDISPDNDWSLLRIWYPRRGDYGASAWPAYGFVHPVAA
ncbi:CHAP domain-containing protein [Paracraurococcus ruber]|uniref:CHAP domain-containing protein n=1 Tax=Paracraurococcus ruber TaxID=77675 RepID=A0ABS1CUP4_9PROT|nr:CHAP domain-containing protein [Paracraurococcus ruber]MBK1658021.1 CHAP domain-containing protein [Paracraurococcus ruber]TDG31759.1 CHAP domain-containing protein [Paracraurococcus ruber]